MTSLDSVLLPTAGNSQLLDYNGNWLRATGMAKMLELSINIRDATGEALSPASSLTLYSWGGTPCASSSHDGIPDAWKKAHGYSIVLQTGATEM